MDIPGLWNSSRVFHPINTCVLCLNESSKETYFVVERVIQITLNLSQSYKEKPIKQLNFQFQKNQKTYKINSVFWTKDTPNVESIYLVKMFLKNKLKSKVQWNVSYSASLRVYTFYE
jgi:hypothetical protein